MIPADLLPGAEFITRSRWSAEAPTPVASYFDLLKLGRSRRSFGTAQTYPLGDWADHARLPRLPNFDEVMQTRQSKRAFSPRELPVELLAQVLKVGCCDHPRPAEAGSNSDAIPGFNRSWASAGGLYSVEAFVIAENVGGLPRGLFHLDAHAAQLSHVAPLDAGQGHLVCGDHHDDIPPAASVVLVADFARCTAKYILRGYRYALMDTGHISQAILLVAHSRGLAAYPSAQFHDEELSQALAVDGDGLAPMLAIGLGIPAGPGALLQRCAGRCRERSAHTLPGVGATPYIEIELWDAARAGSSPVLRGHRR